MKMGHSTTHRVKKQYGLRGNKAMCDQSGVPLMSYNGRTQWDGLFVSEDIYEPRQPQDMQVKTQDRMTPPVARPIKVRYIEPGEE